MEEHIYRSISHKNYWEKRLADWEKSGKSGIEWCREANESYYKFKYWKKTLLPADKQTQSIPNKFIEIQQEDPKPQNVGIYLEYQNIRLHLEKDFNETTLKKLLSLLQDISCLPFL